ncbi:MAG TPA: cytochrome c biogenesis protein CcsA [Pirellulales bacterium]|jgi:ABC-type uncharacterized transport system permease subunit|nr:cytochrome c biogenesis protein CcsA [Pirellulales bacterium]
MLSRISITCFAASYAVALLLELTRLWFRSGVRGAAMLAFAGAGLIAHTMFLAYRGLTTSGGIPLSSEFDWYLIAAWALTVVYLYLTVYHPRTAFGPFVLPVVLGLVGIAARFADRTPFPRSQALEVWGMIHGLSLLAGTVAVATGFVGGVMCLVQARRLKHKVAPHSGLQLPSLEWLERLNARAITISMMALAIGFLSGIVLNLVNDRLHVDHLPWSDPIVWSSALLLGWLVAAAGFTWFYRPARQGRKVAYLTVASFLFLVLAVVVRVGLPSVHGGGRSSEASLEPQAEARP